MSQATYAYTRGVVSGVTLTVGGNAVIGASAIGYRPGDLAMASWTSSNGLATTLGYDTDMRLTAISVPGVQSLGFTYDAANRITRIANGIDGSLTQNFGYDAQSRLTSVFGDAANESYSYDANGNRLTQVVNGASDTLSYAAASNRLLGRTGVTYGYDPQGNLASLSTGTTYQFDAFNRLVQAAGTSYYVNPEGQRLRKTSVAGTTYFAPDLGNALMAENDDGAWVDYVWLNGRLIGRISGGQVEAIHVDQVGRPEAVTDAGRTLVWRAQNLAFTRNVVLANGIALNLGFPGQYYDAETGYWNNGFRDYDAAVGRYVESDPIGLSGGANTYAYVGNGPLSYADPRGLAVGDLPPPPPGYNPKTWTTSQWENGRWVLTDPDRNTWTIHSEDAGHWRHWDKQDSDGNDEGQWPPNCGKPWPGQKKLKKNQCESDPNGDAQPWDPTDPMPLWGVPFVPLPSGLFLPMPAPALAPGVVFP